MAPEVAALFKEPWEYVPGEKGRKEETRDGSMDDDEDDASSIPDLEPAEKWGQPIPEGFEEETEDTSLLRRMALATMHCDDGVGVWDRSEGEDEGNGDDQDGDASHHGRDEEGRGRKRKRDDVEEEEEGRVVMVAARRMRVSEKRVQVEMTARATLRKAEAVKGVERSGRRPDLEGTWEGRGERRVAWESMNRQKKNHRNKSKAGKRKTGDQRRKEREARGGQGRSQQQRPQQQQQQQQQPLLDVSGMLFFYTITFKMFWPLVTTNCGNLRLQKASFDLNMLWHVVLMGLNGL